MSENGQLQYVDSLRGHSGWVTSIATTAEAPDMIVSGSRDKTVIVWQLLPGSDKFGVPKKALTGHNGFVSDVCITADGEYAISSSWDKTLRLWQLSTGKCTTSFVGHTKDVLSVSISPDSRQIVSASRDKTIKLWNTLGECKYTTPAQDNHSEWVSCIRFSPAATEDKSTIASGGWDKTVKVWNLKDFKLKNNHFGHEGYINFVAISPDGSLCSSGGKDGVVMLWDLTDGKHLYSLEAGNIVNSLAFSPARYWLAAATDSSIKIWDLEGKTLVDELKPQVQFGKNSAAPACVSLAWSYDGKYLFAGYTDSVIRVYVVTSSM